MNLPFSKKYFSTAFYMFLVLPFVALLASPAHAVNIGYVDAHQLIQEAPQGQDEIKKLETEFLGRKKKLQEAFEKFQKQRKKFEKEGLLLEDKEREAKIQVLREQERHLKRDEREYNEDFQLRRGEELGKLERVITAAIIAVAEREKLDVVLQQAVYASSDINVTDKVLEELKRRHREN